MRTLLLVLLAGLSAPFTVAETEEPEFLPIAQREGYAVRHYDALVVATIEVRGSHAQGINRGFRALAGFIFGGNSENESIAMTAPVMQRETTVGEVADGDRRFEISFVMPDKFTLDTLPQPDQKDVKLHTLAPQTYAVIQFPGRGSEENFQTHRTQLADALKRDGVESLGEPIYAQYDEPWIPASKRRNEVLWPVADSAGATPE